jgi:hypothetical protein
MEPKRSLENNVGNEGKRNWPSCGNISTCNVWFFWFIVFLSVWSQVECWWAFRPPYFQPVPSLNIVVGSLLLVGTIQTVECFPNCIWVYYTFKFSCIWVYFQVCERERKNCSYDKNLRTESPWLSGTQFGECRSVLTKQSSTLWCDLQNINYKTTYRLTCRESNQKRLEFEEVFNQSFTVFGLPVSVISSRDHFMLVREYVSVERNMSRERFMSYSS